jgi:predicted RNA-binding protein Jag
MQKIIGARGLVLNQVQWLTSAILAARKVEMVRVVI